MLNSELDLQKLKLLSKDEDSYEELLSILNNLMLSQRGDNYSDSEVINLLKNGFDNFFWYIKNAETNEFIFYSDSVEKITGYSYAELITMPGGLLSLIYDDDLQRVKQIYMELAQKDTPDTTTFDYRSITKDDDVIWFRTTVSAERNNDGKILNYKGVTYEVSEFKDTVTELKENYQNLVELNSTKDRFISIVSHDLRTPFTSLLGFSEILLNDKELTEHEKVEYLEYIYDASKTQLQMINYLLDWSKLQTGKLNIEPARVNLKELISNCVSVLTGAAIRKNVEIKMDVADDLYVHADERLINQTVSNLLSNSIKFTPAGKKVYAEASYFKKGFLEIIIKDEGIGISEKNKAKLFKIDQKFSLPGTNGEKGSGLGLTLVKEIVEKHSGNIWFYSKENEGSEFHITLPEAKNFILLVDEQQNLVRYTEIIKRSLPGFEIIQATNGYEAISVLLDKVPSIVMSAHNLPLMNGIQLVESIRKKFSNHAIPVVIIAENLTEEEAVNYLELSVDQTISPFCMPEELTQIIKKTLE